MKLFPSSGPKQIHTEDELQSLSKNDIYRRKKWVADVVTIVFSGLILLLGALFAWWIVDDQAFRDSVKEVILNNLVGIVVSGLVIIGFSTFDRSRSG